MNKKYILKLIYILKLLDNWKMFLFLSLVGFITEGCLIQAITYSRKIIVDSVVNNSFQQLIKGSIFFIIGALLSTGCVIICDYFVLKLTKRMEYSIQRKIAINSFKKSFEVGNFGINLESSDKMFRSTKDVKEISDFYETIYLSISCTGRTIGAIIIGLTYSWQLSILILILSLVNLYIEKISFGHLYDISAKLKKEENKYFSHLVEIINSHSMIRLLVNKKRFAERRLFVERSYKKVSIQSGKLNAKIGVKKSGFYAIVNLLVIVVGVYLVINKGLSIGQLVAFIAIQGTLIDPYRYLTNFIEKYSDAVVSYDRIRGLIVNYDAGIENNKLIENLKDEFSIEGKNIGFHYDNNKNEILRDVNFKFKSGNIYYVVGSSGCGKTTFLKLIANQINPTKGNILFNSGGKIKELNFQNITYVTQNPFCFNGTIKENIVLNDLEYDENRLIEASKKAGIYSHIMSLPNKFESIIKDNGLNFSSGQVTRLAMARAFYRDSNIMLLDEVFASLDMETAENLRKCIEKNNSLNKLIIIVTHRQDWIPEDAQILKLS